MASGFWIFLIILGGFFIYCLYLIVQTQMRKPDTGMEGLIGKSGIALDNLEPGNIGRAEVGQEVWKVQPDEYIAKDENVMITGFSKTEMVLTVKKGR